MFVIPNVDNHSIGKIDGDTTYEGGNVQRCCRSLWTSGQGVSVEKRRVWCPLLSLSHVVYPVGADWQWWQNDRPPSRNILFGLVTTDLQYLKVRSKKWDFVNTNLSLKEYNVLDSKQSLVEATKNTRREWRRPDLVDPNRTAHEGRPKRIMESNMGEEIIVIVRAELSLLWKNSRENSDVFMSHNIGQWILRYRHKERHESNRISWS